jgi:hypothetical protein
MIELKTIKTLTKWQRKIKKSKENESKWNWYYPCWKKFQKPDMRDKNVNHKKLRQKSKEKKIKNQK